MKHERILIPCDCRTCLSAMPLIDRMLAYFIAVALLIAFVVLIRA